MMSKIISTLIALVLVIGISSYSNAENPQSQKIGLNVGNKAPDIAEKGIDGEIIKLADLKGKLVLIDFWAAWCGPCRRENPNLVNAYNKYKDTKFKNGDGFTVFSVSLDQSKAMWEAAIKKDGLLWPYHVSDLKGWSAKFARVYGVNSIPASFLIDGNGVIIGQNLSGPMLHKTLESQKKK